MRTEGGIYRQLHNLNGRLPGHYHICIAFQLIKRLFDDIQIMLSCCIQKNPLFGMIE